MRAKSKEVPIGTKIKVITAQVGAFGANGATGIVCEKPLLGASGLANYYNALYVDFGKTGYPAGIWNIGRNSICTIIEEAPKHTTLEFEELKSNLADTFRRTKVFGGWLVIVTSDVAHITPINGIQTNWDWRTSMTFVLDPLHLWRIKK